MMSPRTILVLAAGTAAALPAMGTGFASAHTTRFDSDVSIQVGVSFPTNSYVFNGDVTSPRGGCVADRRVTLFRDESSGADEALGSDRSDETGLWSVSKPISEVPGNTRYYAQVKKRDIGRPGHDHICRGARSGTIEIE